jgi:hypothetical protein
MDLALRVGSGRLGTPRTTRSGRPVDAQGPRKPIATAPGPLPTSGNHPAFPTTSRWASDQSARPSPAGACMVRRAHHHPVPGLLGADRRACADRRDLRRALQARPDDLDQPSFLWMMYRSGWATKPGQERVLATAITRDGLEWALAHAASVTTNQAPTPAARHGQSNSGPARSGSSGIQSARFGSTRSSTGPFRLACPVRRPAATSASGSSSSATSPAWPQSRRPGRPGRPHHGPGHAAGGAPLPATRSTLSADRDHPQRPAGIAGETGPPTGTTHARHLIPVRSPALDQQDHELRLEG